jgi:hypothetical protein
MATARPDMIARTGVSHNAHADTASMMPSTSQQSMICKSGRHCLLTEVLKPYPLGHP